MNYGWRFVTLYRRQESRPSPRKRKAGWGIHVNPWLIHVNVWQNPLQYCEVISLQLIKINGKKRKKKKCKKAKWLSEEALQIAVEREAKSKGEKERYTHLNAEFRRIARRDKKAFLSASCTMSQTFVHSSSGPLSIKSNPLNLFVTSTV